MAIQQVTAGSKYESLKTIKLEAAATRAKGDVVRISTGGATGCNVDLSLADDTNVYKVAVCLEAAAVGDVYEAAVEGTVLINTPSISTTVGHGVDIFDGAVRDSTTAAEARSGATTSNDFGIVVVAAASSTTQLVTLYGNTITGQT